MPDNNEQSTLEKLAHNAQQNIVKLRLSDGSDCYCMITNIDLEDLLGGEAPLDRAFLRIREVIPATLAIIQKGVFRKKYKTTLFYSKTHTVRDRSNVVAQKQIYLMADENAELQSHDIMKVRFIKEGSIYPSAITATEVGGKELLNDYLKMKDIKWP